MFHLDLDIDLHILSEMKCFLGFIYFVCLLSCAETAAAMMFATYYIAAGIWFYI